MENNQNNNQNTNQSPEEVNREEAVAPDEPMRSIDLPLVEEKRTWYRGKAVWIVLILALIIGGASYAYYMSQSAQTTNNVSTNDQTMKATSTPTPEPLAPYAIAFSKETSGTPTADCGVSTTSISQQLVDNDDAVIVADIKDNQAVSNHAVFGKMVAVTTYPSCSSKQNSMILLSTDSGKTYKTVYTSPNKDDQITSLLFSNDGESIVFGFLPAKASKNTVKELGLSASTANDLFTVDARGVFLQAYNRNNGQLYYYSGCYNCGGVGYDKLLVHDTIKDTDSIVFDENTGFISQGVTNSDLSKLLRASSKVPLDFLDKTAKFTIDEFDIATKKSSTIANFDGTRSMPVAIGYSNNDDYIYYSNDKRLISIDNDGKSTTLLEASAPIAEVYYLGSDQIIYSTRGQQSSQLVSYNVESKKSTVMLDYDYMTRVFGVILQ